MSAVAGSVFAAPDADWVLFEMPMPEMRTPLAYFSAFVEAPWDALDGVEGADPLPINGVAWDKATEAQYVVDAVLAFPPSDGANVATINEEKKIFSLLVDLRSFAASAIVRIGLYGFIKTYYIIAGLGTDGPFNGSIFSSEFYGSVTPDYRGIVTFTPGALDGATEKLFILATKSGGDIGHTRLVSSFPELGAFASAYLTNGLGDQNWYVSFHSVALGGGAYGWDTDIDPFIPGIGANDYLATNPTAVAPTDAPNDYIIYPVSLAWDGTDASIQTTVLWPASAIVKTKTMHSNNVQDGHGNVAAIVDPVGTGEIALINGFNQVRYYVPTWKFTDDREVPANIAAQVGVPLWVDQAKHVTPAPDSSYTWETADYPTRVEMAEIGTGVISNADDADGAITPANHFGQIRIGTLVIHRASGLMEFLPVVAAPIDGGTTGDGPDGDGTAPGRTANPELRTWTYSLDGHDYYVLRLGDSLTLVYDDSSEQWMDWTDYDSLTWRAHCGINWTGAQLLADTYGSSIVAGDDAYGLLWFLDPNQPYDDAPGSGDPIIYFSRVTVGQVPMKGRGVLPCYAAWLTADMGDPAYLGAGVTLYSSDDAGVTWDNHGFVSVTADENSPELSWYSLGQIAAPGRLFKIFDNGAITRIDGLEMNDPDDEK